MTSTWLRLSLRLARFELLAFGAVILGLIIAALLGAAWIDSLRPSADCFSGFNPSQAAGCGSALNAWQAAQNLTTSLVSSLLIFVSFAAGLFLGVPIVARELERGTSRLAWSLTPSRTRWYLARMVPVLAVLAMVTFGAGIALDRVTAATAPGVDPANAFVNFGSRGLLIASRAVFIFAVGVAVGTIVGRALPAIILGAIIAAVGLSGGEAIHQRILRAEAVPVSADQESFGMAASGDLFIDQRFRLPDGSLVDCTYFNCGAMPLDQNGNPIYPIVNLVVPGTRYRMVETREALVLAGGSLAGLVLAGFVVARRRPG